MSFYDKSYINKYNKNIVSLRTINKLKKKYKKNHEEITNKYAKICKYEKKMDIYKSCKDPHDKCTKMTGQIIVLKSEIRELERLSDTLIVDVHDTILYGRIYQDTNNKSFE